MLKCAVDFRDTSRLIIKCAALLKKDKELKPER